MVPMIPEEIEPSGEEMERKQEPLFDDPDDSDASDDSDDPGHEPPAPTVPGPDTQDIDQDSQDTTLRCPYCGAENELFLEPSVQSSEQEYDEECWECGRTFMVRVAYDGAGGVRIHASRQD